MLTRSLPQLRIVVAVHAEARPVLKHYRMRRDPDCRLPVYDGEAELAGDRHPASLVVSGVGKTACAAATGYLAATRPAPLPVWINVGIVGHRDLPIGEAFAVHRIHDAATGRNFFPSLVGCRLRSWSLTTVDRPERQFQTEDLYEMEASAFYESTLSFTTTELIQCLKVVSDNRLSPANGLTKESITDLIASQLESFESLATDLLRLALVASTQTHEPMHLEAFTARWHFSRTQRLRLHHLLRRAELLLDESLRPDRFEGRNLAQEVLADLEELMEAAVLHATRRAER